MAYKEESLSQNASRTKSSKCLAIREVMGDYCEELLGRNVHPYHELQQGTRIQCRIRNAGTKEPLRPPMSRRIVLRPNPRSRRHCQQRFQSQQLWEQLNYIICETSVIKCLISKTNKTKRSNLTAAMCWRMMVSAETPTILSSSHFFKVLAFNIVSAVVKVFDTTITRVVSGSRPVSARDTSVGSTLAKKRNVRPFANSEAFASVRRAS